jgi:hypothetical protein
MFTFKKERKINDESLRLPARYLVMTLQIEETFPRRHLSREYHLTAKLNLKGMVAHDGFSTKNLVYIVFANKLSSNMVINLNFSRRSLTKKELCDS